MTRTGLEVDDGMRGMGPLGRLSARTGEETIASYHQTNLTLKIHLTPLCAALLNGGVELHPSITVADPSSYQ